MPQVTLLNGVYCVPAAFSSAKYAPPYCVWFGYPTDCQAVVLARKERMITPVSGASSTSAMPLPVQSMNAPAADAESIWQYGNILVRDGSRAKLSEALVNDTTPSVALFNCVNEKMLDFQ